MVDFVFKNMFVDIEQIFVWLGYENGVCFEFECYDVGYFYNLVYFVDCGFVELLFFIQCIFGIFGGIGVDGDNFVFMKLIVEKLFGFGFFQLFVFVVGWMQMCFLIYLFIIGGNVCVGLEDNFYLGLGVLVKSNVDQVVKIWEIMDGFDFEVVMLVDVRCMFCLKGKENVVF